MKRKPSPQLVEARKICPSSHRIVPFDITDEAADAAIRVTSTWLDIKGDSRAVNREKMKRRWHGLMIFFEKKISAELMPDAETRTAPDDTRLVSGVASDPSPPTAEQTQTAWKKYQAEQAAAVLNEELVRALEKCAASFLIGDQNGLISREEFAREFNRRQKIAKAALSRAKPSP